MSTISQKYSVRPHFNDLKPKLFRNMNLCLFYFVFRLLELKNALKINKQSLHSILLRSAHFRFPRIFKIDSHLISMLWIRFRKRMVINWNQIRYFKLAVQRIKIHQPSITSQNGLREMENHVADLLFLSEILEVAKHSQKSKSICPSEFTFQKNQMTIEQNDLKTQHISSKI